MTPASPSVAVKTCEERILYQEAAMTLRYSQSATIAFSSVAVIQVSWIQMLLSSTQLSSCWRLFPCAGDRFPLGWGFPCGGGERADNTGRTPTVLLGQIQQHQSPGPATVLQLHFCQDAAHSFQTMSISVWLCVHDRDSFRVMKVHNHRFYLSFPLPSCRWFFFYMFTIASMSRSAFFSAVTFL